MNADELERLLEGQALRWHLLEAFRPALIALAIPLALTRWQLWGTRALWPAAGLTVVAFVSLAYSFLVDDQGLRARVLVAGQAATVWAVGAGIVALLVTMLCEVNAMVRGFCGTLMVLAMLGWVPAVLKGDDRAIRWARKGTRATFAGIFLCAVCLVGRLR